MGGGDEKNSHLSCLQLFLCLKLFFKNRSGIHELLRLDNSTAVAYINKKGGMVSKYCNDLAFVIWN